jgi:hypothetical protein
MVQIIEPRYYDGAGIGGFEELLGIDKSKKQSSSWFKKPVKDEDTALNSKDFFDGMEKDNVLNDLSKK